MKKRKLLLLVTVGFVLLYLLSTFTFAFMSFEIIENEQRRVSSSFSLQMQEDVHNFLENSENGQKSTEEDFNRLLYNMTYLYESEYPTLFALIDNRTNEVVVRSKSIVNFYDADTGDSRYIDVESYLTPEIKAELWSIAEELNHNRINLTKISFAIEDGKYIPVEMTVGTGRMEDYKTVKITDYTPEIFIDNNQDDFLVLHNYAFQQEGYTANLYKMMEGQLKSKLKEIIATDINGTVSESYFGVGNRGYNSHTQLVSGTDYKHYSCFLIGPAYNEYYEAFTDEHFVGSMILQGILFAIAYLIALRVATKIYRKSEQMTRSQRAFTSAAAHELKTPLAVIQNQCECIIENVAPEKNDTYIKSVYDESVRMNGIVGSFLQYNRLVNADKLQKEKCSLREIVLTEIEKYRAFADMQGVELASEICDNDVVINCNRDLISMAVDNYLSNAIKYATGEKKVAVKLEKSRFSVYNTSEGISRETADSMWDILSRDNKARTKDGSSTGMGLPICAEIFKAHGFEYGYRKLQGKVEFYFEFK